MTATRFEVDADGIAWLTLDRPDAANARNQQMRLELLDAYDRAAADDDVRVLVLTGAGDRFFCAGMDLKEASGDETQAEKRDRLRGARDIEVLAAFPKPTIAAVNGYALGGGLEMAMACDLRIAAVEAVVGLTEVDHGLVPGGGGTQRLPRLVGLPVAFDLIYRARKVDGAEAARLGLVHQAVPRADLRQTVAAVAAEITAKPVRALRAAKELLRKSLEMPLAAGVDAELDALLFLMQAKTDASGPQIRVHSPGSADQNDEGGGG